MRNKYHIHVKGSNPPDPIETFEEMKNKFDIDPQVFDNLYSCGYSVPTPIQMQAIPVMANVRVSFIHLLMPVINDFLFNRVVH